MCVLHAHPKKAVLSRTRSHPMQTVKGLGVVAHPPRWRFSKQVNAPALDQKPTVPCSSSSGMTPMDCLFSNSGCFFGALERRVENSCALQTTRGFTSS